jgi:hypothetical protein
MSEELVNTWKPREEIVLNCPSGSRCIVQKPGPELALMTTSLNRRLRALRVASGIKEPDPERMTDKEIEEAALDALEKMTDEQKELSLQITRITVVACVKKPKLYLNPKPGQLGVDDIDEADFYFVYKWYHDGCKAPVPDESEVTSADVNRFPSEQTASVGTSDSVSDVRSEAVAVDEAA